MTHYLNSTLVERTHIYYLYCIWLNWLSQQNTCTTYIYSTVIWEMIVWIGSLSCPWFTRLTPGNIVSFTHIRFSSWVIVHTAIICKDKNMSIGAVCERLIMTLMHHAHRSSGSDIQIFDFPYHRLASSLLL